MNSQEGFEFQAHVRHGDEYSYHRTQYVDNSVPVSIHCGKHGMFEMTPDDHALKGHRCPQCVEDQFEAMRREKLFQKVKARYFEAYGTFNGDIAYEVYETQNFEELAMIIEGYHKDKVYALIELFNVMALDN